ncbi:MAG: hypothetical protein PWQ91_1029 [Eubacteriales bacterium]|nr:hypothetical protein [Eubacteriales bacterium]MDN5363968.1 hypothetical protein [Eubacteriales bacterium]
MRRWRMLAGARKLFFLVLLLGELKYLRKKPVLAAARLLQLVFRKGGGGLRGRLL